MTNAARSAWPRARQAFVLAGAIAALILTGCGRDEELERAKQEREQAVRRAQEYQEQRLFWQRVAIGTPIVLLCVLLVSRRKRPRVTLAFTCVVPKWPRTCACCGGQEEEELLADDDTGRISVPYCSPCKAHAIEYRRWLQDWKKLAEDRDKLINVTAYFLVSAVLAYRIIPPPTDLAGVVTGLAGLAALGTGGWGLLTLADLSPVLLRWLVCWLKTSRRCACVGPAVERAGSVQGHVYFRVAHPYYADRLIADNADELVPPS